MPMKIVVFYNQFNQGWSEVYYYAGTVAPSVFVAGLSTANLTKLVTFRHSSTYIYAIRASVVGSPRVSYTKVFNAGNVLAGTPISVPDTGEGVDVASTDAFFEIYDTSGNRRPLFVRGLNDVDVIRNANGVSTPSSNLTTGMSKMITALANMNLCVATAYRPPNNGLVWYQVNTVTAIGTGAQLITSAPVAGTTPGVTQIVFQGIPSDDLPGFPRIATVVVASQTAPYATLINYRVRISGTTGAYAPSNMRFCVLVYQYLPIFDQGAIFIKFSERKTGRVFGASRGRQSVKIRAQ